MDILFSILRAFAITAALEAIVMLLMFRNGRYVYYSLLCNMLTNPAMNVILVILVMALGHEYYYICLALLEFIVLFIEAYVLRVLAGFTWKKAFFTSFLLNVISLSAGLLINSFANYTY